MQEKKEKQETSKKDEKGKKDKDKSKKSKKWIKYVIVLVILGGVLLKIYWPKIINPNVDQVTTISKSSLEKILEISDLQTLEYTYNAVTDVTDENGNIKYHVAYEGRVTAGIDFSKIEKEIDEEKKTIKLILPQAKIQEVSVDTGTMDYIFERKKYETETVSHEAYKACIDDLKKRADKEADLLDIASENSLDTIKALVEPWVKEIDASYKVEVVSHEK